MFKKFTKMKRRYQLLFAMLIGFAVVSFWRGAWGLLDLYLLPNDSPLSMWTSMIIGFSILVLTRYATKELM